MVDASHCSRCGSRLADGGLEGQCPHCLAGLAFGVGEERHADAGGRGECGDYEFIRELGRGGMGVVCEARHKSLHRRVALKWLSAGGLASPGLLERFRVEAETTARLRHPNIVTVYEVGELDGRPFLAMELVDGPSFEQVVRTQPLSPKRAARYLRLVAEAIAHAHGAGVIHRDLKPSNILLDPDDQPRVTDFGLAKFLDHASALTLTGEVLGSPNYLPPEQVAGTPVGVTGDVYALGAVLYQFLTTRPPFTAPTVAATLQQVLHEEPIAPRVLNPAVPRDLETICLACLRKEPARRYTSASALAEDLARFEAGEPIRARPVSWGERLLSWCRRKPALAALIAGWVAAIVGGFVMVLQQWRRAEASRAETATHLYAADVAAAATALGEGNLGRARGLLLPYGPPAEVRKTSSADGASSDRPSAPSPFPTRFSEPQPTPEFAWRLLWERCRGDERAVMATHPWIVTCVAVSPDGHWVASGSQDPPEGATSTLQLTDLRPWTGSDAGSGVAVSLPNSNTVWSVGFTADSRTLVTAGLGGLRFWDVPGKQSKPSYPVIPGQEMALATNVVVASPNHPFFDGTASEPMRWLDLETREVRVLDVRGRHPALSADGRRLAFLDSDRRIQIHELPSGRRLGTVATNQLVFRLRFSPDGTRLAAAGQGTSAKVWDLSRWGGSPVLFPSGHNVWDVAFSTDGGTVVTSTSHQQLEIWDARTATRRGMLAGHENEVWTVTTTPDGRFAVSGSKDRSVRLWSLGAESGPVTIPSAREVSPAVSADGRYLLTTAVEEGKAVGRVWAFEGGPRRGRVALKAVGVVVGQSLGFVADGAGLLRVHPEGREFETVEPSSGRSLRRISIEAGSAALAVSTISLSGDGRCLAGRDREGALGRWQLEDGRRLGHWRGWPIDRVRSVAQAGRGETAAPDRLRARAASHTGRWFAFSVFGTGAGALVDFETGIGRPLRGHRDDVAAFAFSRDERWLCTGSVDGTVRLWRVASGELEAELPGHFESIEAVALSPDGQTLASASPGIGITFWHVATRRELARLPHSEVGHHLLFSPDGRRLVLSVTEGNLETHTDRVELWEAPWP